EAFVGFRLDQPAFPLAGDAAAAGDQADRRSRLRGEQDPDVDLQAAADARQLVVAERHLVVLDLRQGGDRQAGAATDLGQRPAVGEPQALQYRPWLCLGVHAPTAPTATAKTLQRARLSGPTRRRRFSALAAICPDLKRLAEKESL